MIVKVEMSIWTRYVGSTIKDIVEVEVDDDATEKEIEKEIQEYYDEWVWSQIDGGYKRIEK